MVAIHEGRGGAAQKIVNMVLSECVNDELLLDVWCRLTGWVGSKELESRSDMIKTVVESTRVTQIGVEGVE